MAQWYSNRTSTRKVIGSTLIERTRIFLLPNMPVSMTEEIHLSQAATLLLPTKLFGDSRR